MTFADELNAERRAYYARAGGGLALPVAGGLYWAVLAGVGWLRPDLWMHVALFGSGAIYPLGLLLAKPTGSDPHAKSPLRSLTFPALMGVMLMWAVTFATVREAPELTPLALAVGMAVHWPAIGWQYGRTWLFTGHAVVRTVAASAVWYALPDERLTLLPAAVAAAYAGIALVILLDRPRRAAALA